MEGGIWKIITASKLHRGLPTVDHIITDISINVSKAREKEERQHFIWAELSSCYQNHQWLCPLNSGKNRPMSQGCRVGEVLGGYFLLYAVTREHWVCGVECVIDRRSCLTACCLSCLLLCGCPWIALLEFGGVPMNNCQPVRPSIRFEWCCLKNYIILS